MLVESHKTVPKVEICFGVQRLFPSPIQVKRPVTLHDGHRDLSINTWDSQGLKMTITVRILLRHHHEIHHHNVEHHHEDHKHQQHVSEVGSEVGLDTLEGGIKKIYNTTCSWNKTMT